MTTALRLSATAALVALLSACGGGGGTSSPNPTTPPPAQNTGPASTSTADLITFAQGGSATQLDAGVSRQTRNFTQNGLSGTVSVDRLAGTDFGLVQYRLGNDVSIYRLTGEVVSSMTLPSGFYNGPLAMNYRFDANSGWSVVQGEVNLVLNFETGELAIGGIASNEAHSIEIFGDAIVVNNEFVTTDATLRLRDAAAGGTFIRDEIGSVSGIAVSEGDNSAIFGLVDSTGNATGFEAVGGFTAILFLD